MRILLWKASGGHDAYIGCNGSWGLIYTAIQLLVARVLSGTIYLHHHSFEYIHKESYLMRILLRCAGPNVVHLFLCCEMQKRFFARYREVDAIVLENSVFVPPHHGACPRGREEKVVIGLLSNLGREKGLYSFIDLLESTAEMGMPVSGMLAGPAFGEDLQAVQAALTNPRIDLTYLGPTYGRNKTHFYRDIDVFVFPTEYETEAQPTVIFEAQSHGRPVIARGLACIPSQLAGGMGCVPPKEDFVPSALTCLQKMAFEQDLHALQAETLKRYKTRRQEALGQLDEIARSLER